MCRLKTVLKHLARIADIPADGDATADVYTLMGVKVLSKVNPSQRLDLPSGIYIVRYAFGYVCRMYCGWRTL